MEDLTLKMPTSTSDSIEGLNDGNIETYKNTLLLSLTKEELQNSTDQALVGVNGQPMKVTVEFKDFYLSKSQFPEFEKTKKIYEDERMFWDEYLQNDKKSIKFFDNAINLLNQDKIRCLRVSDFNTTGLTGIHLTTSSPWNNLVKNKGVSDKPGNSGGSFGIGKDAAYACSQLRIVFYNTINKDGESGFQGCMKMPNYKSKEKTYLGKNFYCKSSSDNKCNPIEESRSLDSEYSRDRVGMDKFIIGFDTKIGQDDLKKDIIVSSLDNFLTAFFMDKLEIKYGDEIIDKDYLYGEKFENLKPDLSNETIEYLETLKNPDEIVKLSMFEEEDILIYVKLDPTYSRKAAVVRQNGMKVFDKTHISARIGFSAVVYLAKNNVNKYFKALENQEHNRWARDRADDPKEAQKKQDEIFDTLRAKVKELNGANVEGTVDSDGLGEYLPFTYITGKKNKVEGLSNEIEDTKKKAKKKHKKTPLVNVEEEIEYIEDENGNLIAQPVHHGENETPPGPIPPIPPIDNEIDISNDGDGNQVSESDKKGDFVSKKEIPSKSLKLHLFRKNDEYILKLKSDEYYKKGFFEVSISGEDSSANIAALISSANINGVSTVVKGNRILFREINDKDIYIVGFKLDMPGEWALEVKAHESKN